MGSWVTGRRANGTRNPSAITGARVAVLGLLLATAALAAVPPALAAVPGPGLPHGPGGRASALSGAFFGVTAISAGDAWAVGQSGTTTLRTLIAHWNGTAWRRVPSPNPAPGGDDLNAVAATSAANAWAVGGQNGQPLILRWNGTAWAQAPSPVLASGGALAAIAAVSATDAWAVGLGGPKDDLIIIEHWDGTAWAQVPSPVRVGNLIGLAATSASDVWAVGLAGNPAGTTAALTMHYNGTAWARVPAPNPPNSGELLGVAATASTDGWAVSGAAGQAIGTNKTVIDHWDGRAWTRVHSPNPAPGGAILFGVAADSASDAWAVGADTDFVTSFENVIEHWNGASWTVARGAVRDGSLFAVAAPSASAAWAVGGDGSGRPLIERWNGTQWTRASFS